MSELLNHKIDIASVPGGFLNNKVAKAAYEVGIKYLMTSEPERKIKYYKDMMIIGRYTMFNYKTESFASALALNKTNELFKEYLYWYFKKVAKKSLGNSYITFKNYILETKAKQ